MSDANPYAQLAAAGVTGLSPYEPGMPAAALEREYGVRDAVKLASNENPYPLPASVQAAMQAACTTVTRYPDGAAFDLRDSLARHLGVKPEQVTLGNGSNDVLVLLAETFLTPAHAAVYDQYSFVVYRLAVQAVGAQARVAKSNPVAHAQPLGHDLAAMRALVDDVTRLVFIANPNNPTGTWVEPDELHEFLRAMPEHVLVVLDEAYCEYAEGEGYADSLEWLTQFPNLVIVRTFSKAYGLAGLRVGYGISSPAVAELLNRVRQPFNVNSVAQAAAVAALGEQGWVADCRHRNTLGLARLTQALNELGWQCVPSRGNFVLAHIGPDAAACHEHLLRQGVIVRPVANYGLPEYLRVSVGTEAENDRLIAALTSYRDSNA